MSNTTKNNTKLAACLCLGLLTQLACSSDDPGPGAGGAGQAGQGGGSAGSAAGMTNGSGAAGAAGAAAGGAAGGSSGGAAGSASAGAAGAAGGGAAGGGAAGGGAAGGGAGGAAGQGGGGGQAPYNPCPTNGDACKVMPLGDSITDLGGVEGSAYRLDLFRLSLMNDKKLTFVGSHESGPAMVDGVPFPRQQEGHSGWTIADGGGRSGLYDEIQGWLMAKPPHIVTLMIGTNDVDIQLDLANAPMRLGLLIDRIAEHAPSALIVVAQIVPTTMESINQRVQTYNAAIPALVKARADAGKHVVMVDMYSAFTENPSYKADYMADTLHPNQAGLVVMANTWWEAIGSLLPPE